RAVVRHSRLFSMRSRRPVRRILLLSAVAAAAVGTLAVVSVGRHATQATASSSAAKAAALTAAGTFNPSLLLKGSNGAGEPSIRTDQYGNAYVIGPIGVPAGCKAFKVKHDGSSSMLISFPDHTAGGGDCDFAIGPKETAPSLSATGNDLAHSSLTLANVTVAK